MKLKVPKKERRKSGDSRGKHILRNVMIVLCVLALMGLAGTHLLKLITGNEMLAIPENGVAAVVTPLQSGFASVVNWISDYFYTLKLRSRLELEYNNLRQENEQLTYQAMLAEELQHKLSVYENLFDEVSDNEQLNPLVATVIGRESGNYFSVFTINKGTRDGIQDYMAVTMNGALVGYTYNTKTTSASVRTIIDSEASIAGLISTSRDQGTVRGTLGIDGQPMCRMYYLPEENLPRPGDQVVTSGVGMSFPKGIPIGTVRESTRGMESNKQFVVVEPQADCPMARQIDPARVAEFRAAHPEYAVVAYINTTAELKAVSDVCVTSSSALKIVRSLPQKDILFIPDKNLGDYVRRQVPEKHIVTWDGYCPVHNAVTAADVLAAKARHPQAKVAMHPECPPEALELADMAGSTAAIIDYIREGGSGGEEVIVATERGVVDRLSLDYPGRLVQIAEDKLVCPDMKRTTVDTLLAAMEGRGGEVIEMDAALMDAARASLTNMITLGA